MKNIRYYYRIAFSIGFFFCTKLTFCQGTDGSEFIQNHNLSPEADSFNQKTNAIDYYTGKVTTNIPIYTFQGREMNLPISMSYTSDGVKVEEISSHVGLGWNLDFGGRVNAMVNREIDYFYYTEILKADLFVLNLPGMYEYFKMEGHRPKAQLNPAITAEIRVHQSSNWIINMPDGSRYHFEDVKERTRIYSGGPNNTWVEDTNQDFISSWLLTKIVSKNGLDVYRFYYNYDSWLNPVPNNGEGYTIGFSANAVTPRSAYKADQKIPTFITHNDQAIFRFNIGNRDDLVMSLYYGNAIASIDILNYNGIINTNSTVFKKVVFDYGYFGNSASSNYLDKRLKLKSMTFVGFNESTPSGLNGDKYEFVYDSSTDHLVPPITSFAQDYQGLYNGQDGNVNLVDDISNHDIPVRRKYDFAKSQYGLLKKVIYPTKGYTEYEFEQNRLNDNFEYFYQEDTEVEQIVDVVHLPFTGSQEPATCYICDPTAGHTSEFQASSEMWTNTFLNYPNVSSGNISETVGITGAYTTLLTVDTLGPYYIVTPNNGRGVFLIQSLDEVACNPSLENASCYYNPPTSDHVLTCLRSLNNIVYKSGQLSPDGFRKGGITHDPNYAPDDSVVLQPGNYQVTLWQYTQAHPEINTPHIPIIPASLRIYKKVLVPVNEHLVNTDIPGTLTDGFRIKSITNYSAPGIFAGRREFKYNRGQKFQELQNYRIGKITSQGYLYKDVLFYQSVSEKQTDDLGIEFNGYTQYSFSDINDPIYPNSTTCQNGIFWNYFDGESSYNFKIEKIHNDALKEKKIYDKNGNLLFSEKNQYGFMDYQTEIFSTTTAGSEYQEYTKKFPYLHATTVTEYPSSSKPLVKSVTYDFENTDVRFLPGSKHITYNNVTENYYFHDILGYNNFTEVFLRASTECPDYTVSYEYVQSTSSPSLVRTITKNNDYEGSIEFIYDSAKNPVTKIKHTPGVLTSASYESTVYGYSERFPVATILGLQYSDLDADLIADIKTASSQPVNETTTTAIIDALKALRDWVIFNHPHAHMTFRTYNPVCGITSTTDAKGRMILTEYDVFGRQLNTKEVVGVGNALLLTEQKYNTRQN